MNRRNFIKLSLGTASYVYLGNPTRSFAAYGTMGALYRSLVPEGATPASKGIDTDWLASLRQREATEPVFTKAADELRYIGMPVGGIGCGTLYLGGDGRLWLWDVWHKSGEGIRPRSRTYNRPSGVSSSIPNRSGVNYISPVDAWNAAPDFDEDPHPFDQGFALRTVVGGSEAVHRLDQRDMADIAFRGSYPLAEIDYADSGCPLEVRLKAHPFFIPLNTPDSALPVTQLEYTLHNPGTQPVDATLLGWLENPVLRETGLSGGMVRVNEIRPGTGFGFLECRAEASAESPFVSPSEYTVFADFEGEDYGDWVTTGTAFGSAPVDIPPHDDPQAALRDVRGVGNRFVNSYLGNGGADGPTGTLTSPDFTLSGNYIHFLLGGGAVPGIRVRLLDAATDAELRTAANASNSNAMQWKTWDVAALAGQSVKIVVEDLTGGFWGQLGFDHVCFSNRAMAPEYVVFEDFERETYAPWTTTGTAFGSGPILISQIPGYQGNVNGIGTRVVNSHASAPGATLVDKESATGTLVSPEFTLTRGYIHWLQGGGSTAAETRVRLLRASDGTELRSQAGDDDNAMTWRTWDVREFRGETVRISIEDLRAAGWANIGVDQIVLSTNPDAPNVSGGVDTAIDQGTIGIAELGAVAGQVAATGDLATAFPWLPSTADGSGAIGRTLTVAPGATETIRFLVAWHFPNLPGGLPGSRREYANRFSDAYAVADYVTANYTRLAGDTRSWVDTWKDSTLPYWLLDRALATTDTLATTNCFWFDDERFYGYEGINCCKGTCTHVWYYAQSMARLFPDLERGLRQNVDLNSAVGLRDDGSVKYRGEYNNDWAWDGQAGVVLRACREHMTSPDNSFLTANWTNIKKVLDFLIGEDGNNDGVSEARQHNTLDADWYGRVPAHICLYGAALEAGARMAAIMGNTAYAATCSNLADQARARMAELYRDGGTNPDYGSGYYIHQLTGTGNGQLGHVEGCYIDQVIGEFYANQLGLPRVTDQNACRDTLRSLWRFNYSHDLTNFLSESSIRQGRPYQMVGEAGLLISTFPNDGNIWSASWQSMYFAECMSGFEYQVAAHCLGEGLLDEGLTIMRAVYDRYHPAKRNPYNEVECSDHYARAMASYGAFLAVSGFSHDGPAGHFQFMPKMQPWNFKVAFTGAEGWGSFAQTRTDTEQTARIEVKYGQARIKTLTLETAAAAVLGTPVMTVNSNPVATSSNFVQGRLDLTLTTEQVLSAGDVLEVTFANWSDSDGDDMPDDFEDQHGLNKHDGADKFLDPDADGQSNINEYESGTHPNDAGSVFVVEGIAVDPAGVQVSWQSVPGRSYTLQYKDKLNDPQWNPLATGVVASAETTDFIDEGISTSRFYRVIAE